MLLYEKERSNKEFYVYHQDDVNLSFPMHIHDSLEFVVVLEGELIISIEGVEYTLKANQASVILPNEAHSYLTKDYSKSYLCIISKDHIPYFCKTIEKLKAVNPVFTLNNAQETIELLKHPKNLFFLKSYVYNILATYYDNTTFVAIDNENKSFLHIILDYVNENYMNDISLKDIAQQMGYTYNYSSMLFNQIFKTSFSEFLNECRITYACNLLKDSDKSIQDIASLCGYNSLRIFNRNFLKFKNQTPTSYRKNNN